MLPLNPSFIVVTVMFASSFTTALNVAVVMLPEFGHMGPLSTIVNEAASRHHHVDVYVAHWARHHCLELIGDVANVSCIGFGNFTIEKFDATFFERLTQLDHMSTFSIIEAEMLVYYRHALQPLLDAINERVRVDIMLIDYGVAPVGLIVADVLKLEAVLFWPLTLSTLGITNPAIPAFASALSARSMPLLSRWSNHMFQRLSRIAMSWSADNVNDVRESARLPPLGYNHMFVNRLVLTPSLVGFDMAQPLCPNIVPLGFVLPPRDTTELPAEWLEWLNTCPLGFVYINMGSVASLKPEWVAVFESVVRQLSVCVIWKISNHQQRYLTESLPSRVRTQHWFPFSPRKLLASPKIRLFVTHCGDTSVYESIFAGIPMVGVPLFADQPDVCARLLDAKIGLVVSKFNLSADLLRSSIESVMTNRMFKNEAMLLRDFYLQQKPGPTLAVEILERTAAFGTKPFLCAEASTETFSIDVLLAVSFGIACLIMIIKRG